MPQLPPPGRTRPVARVAVLIALLVAVLTGCSGSAGGAGGGADPADAAPATTEGIPFAVVGDSLTAAGGRLDGAAAPEGDDRPGEVSWLPGAEGPPLRLAGGWAMDGATTAHMREEVTGYDAEVVVVLAGTNDLLQGIPWDRTRADLLAVADTVGIDRVVLSAVPPLDSRPEASEELNAALADLARDQGWEFVDPWADFAQDGRYVAGASPDGIHPAPMVAFAVGRAIREAVLAGTGA